jgi:subtilase family serine protease
MPSPTHTYTPTLTPSNTPIPGPDLTVSPYQWSSSLPEGTTEFLDYIVRNIGTTTAQGGYLVQLYVDDVPLQNIDPEIGVREGRSLYAGEVDLDYFFWTATCGVHRLKIVVDEENIIQESNESNNITEDYTITVNCGTATPP